MNAITDTLVDLPRVDASSWRIAAAGALESELGEELVHAAAVGARTLPADVDDALLRFTVAPPRAGALLLRNVPIGDLPPTPPTPEAPVAKDLATELALLTVAAAVFFLFSRRNPLWLIGAGAVAGALGLV